MAKEYVDIGIIVPLLEEFQRLQRYFPTKREVTRAVQFHVELDLGESGYRAVAFLQDDMGKAGATRAAEALLAEYEIGVAVVLGIAGGLSGDAAIGDVCFTGTVIDVLENAKISDRKKGGSQTEYNSKFYTTDPVLTFSLRYAQIGSDARGVYDDWALQRYYAAKELVPGEFIGRGDKNEIIGIPQIHDGSIVCGLVSKSEFYNSTLKSIERKALALETESGGAFHSCRLQNTPAIAIRGICDYADKNKNKLEEQINGQGRVIAADNAITFLKMQLFNPQFQKFLRDRRHHVSGQTAPLLPGLELGSLAATAREKVSETIHYHLSQLSPEYHGKPKGYRLPLPRVKPSSSAATVSPAIRRSDPVSLLEVVAANRVSFITVPRNYPDNSLPWVLAAELCLIELDGKLAVPIVIDGESIKPPHSDITQHAEVDVVAIEASDVARAVVILTDFPDNSRTRTEFLRREIEKFPECRFVIMNRWDATTGSESELVIATGAEYMEVCDISFVEMSQFLSRSFDMPDQEAGVIALRLQTMFKKFHLNAHPSYFAGVATEVLTSLLRANRRNELLQLAVSGFLSFVVASDRDDLILSRTTREGFLRSLSFEKRVNKKSFDRSDLIKFVQQYADTHDYEIDPIQFIEAFQEKGIIHFDNGNVAISLPFIESYLLANELKSNPTSAELYFNLNDSDFDYMTFDVYAELGADNKIVTNVLSALDESLQILAEKDGEKHILLTDEIRPSIIDKRPRLRDIQDRLEKAFDDVVNSRPNSMEKQRLLDVAAKAEEGARLAQEAARRNHQTSDNESVVAIEGPLRVWSIATILLGSGSERLERGPKRELALKIVQSTSALADRLLRVFSKFDFSEFKEEVRSDEFLRSLLKLAPDQMIDPGTPDLISTIVDAYELSLLGFPLRALIANLSNTAAQPVLRPSVASVESDHLIENLIARIWSAEIDATPQRGALLDAIAALPPSPFLRFSLSTHFMARVFWHHWETANRLVLLDAAVESIRPLGSSIDKGRFKRLIEARESGKEDE